MITIVSPTGRHPCETTVSIRSAPPIAIVGLSEAGAASSASTAGVISSPVTWLGRSATFGSSAFFGAAATFTGGATGLAGGATGFAGATTLAGAALLAAGATAGFTGALTGARANVFITPRKDGPTEVKMRFHELKEAPADQKFVLWAFVIGIGLGVAGAAGVMFAVEPELTITQCFEPKYSAKRFSYSAAFVTGGHSPDCEREISAILARGGLDAIRACRKQDDCRTETRLCGETHVDPRDDGRAPYQRTRPGTIIGWSRSRRRRSRATRISRTAASAHRLACS